MQTGLVARIQDVVDHWRDDRREEALRLEGKLAEAAADALVDALLEIDDMVDALAESSLSPAEEELRAVATMETEVMNGGFVQFIDNCGLAELELAAAGCARIGAPHFEAILRDALALVPEVPDDDWPEELGERLSALDERFYDAYREVEELLRLRLRYAAEHPDEFRALRA